MRYLVGFIFALALGVMPLVGCFEQLQSGSCSGVVCPDDGDPCTSEHCICDGWWCTPECVSGPAVNGTECTFNGLSGVCASGVCGENLCEGVACDDDDACTDDKCNYVDGMCYFPSVVCDDRNECTYDTCAPADGCIFTPNEGKDGTVCTNEDRMEPELEVGVCEAGVCLGPCDPASEEVSQCPIERFEDFFCCPGGESCTNDCYLEVQP